MMRSSAYNRFGVLMGTSWPASCPRWYGLREDSLPMITLFPSQGDFYATAFFESLRSGYLKRLDFDFCLYLDRETQPLARFLYAHLLKRIGEKSIYTRRLTGFLNDIGLGYVAKLETKRLNEMVKRSLIPALDLV